MVANGPQMAANEKPVCSVAAAFNVITKLKHLLAVIGAVLATIGVPKVCARITLMNS